MVITEYDNIGKDFAEGRGRSSLKQRAELDSKQSDLPFIQRFVILDVIFDPQIIELKKLEYWEHDLGVSNIQYAVAAPRNSVIARRVMNNNSSPAEQAMILYPFFPPNISLPCKAGEHVWVMFEDPSGTRKDLGYWMNRIVTAGFAEDVNHTHPHRAHDHAFVPSIKDVFEGTDIAKYEFRNGTVGAIDNERFTVAETATIPGSEDAYKKLMKDSDAGRITHYEPVPRYRKRPEEQVFEGGSNTLIRMGRDRSGPVATYKDDPERGKLPLVPQNDVQVDGAGVIDLVSGRGQTTATRGNVVQNDLPANELGKSSKELVPDEGDVDYENDRSRVLIAQRTLVDQNFGLGSFNKQFADGTIQGSSSKRIGITDDPASDPNGDGAIVIKTDKLRLIVRSDVEILVTSFDRDADGLMVSPTDTSRYAAFVIKANGDVVVRPSASGYIKLGGDAANKGILCTDQPVEAKDGLVQGPPITTTMGGQVCGSVGDKGALAPGQGRLSAKVLIL